MRVPLFVLGAVSIVNIFASRAMVYGFGPIPRLGVDGIVGGTVVARVLGGVLMLIMLRANINGLCVRWRDIHFGGEHVGRLARIGLPAAIDGADRLVVAHSVHSRHLSDW